MQKQKQILNLLETSFKNLGNSTLDKPVEDRSCERTRMSIGVSSGVAGVTHIIHRWALKDRNVADDSGRSTVQDRNNLICRRG